MVLTTKEFTSAFHALNGTTTEEKRKNLYQLLNANSESTINFTELKPRTLLEETFKTDVLIFFKKHSELVKVLNDENSVEIHKILRLKWFIKETYENINGKQLITDIFPNISYNTKLKLVNKLAVYVGDVSKSDEFFTCIKDAYGIYLASKLLPCCSKEVILKSLETSKIELTPKQLLIIITRNPSITDEIFDKLHSYDTNINIGDKYKYVFRHLMTKNPTLFIGLNEKYNPSFALGKRATRQFIFDNEECFMKNSKKLYRLLKVEQIGKCLPNGFPTVFFDVFPKSLQELIDNFDSYLSLLNSLPCESVKLDLILKTFRSHYNGELLDHPEFLVPKIFEWMSPEFRSNWLEINTRPKEVSEDIWISFMTIEQSIPLIKKKLSYTSNVLERGTLISALVATCKVNRDTIALVDVCKYVVDKHRNDHVKVRSKFLESLQQYFNLNKLSGDHWKHINELIYRNVINDDNFWVNSPFVKAYIYFCLENNLSIEEHLKLWCKVSYGEFNIFTTRPNFEKQCLDTFIQILPLCFKNDELEDRYISYLLSICKWNKQHPTDKISLFKDKDAFNAVITRLEKGEYQYSAFYIAMQCLIADYETSCQKNILELLMNSCSRYSYDGMNTKWLMKNHPLALYNHMERFIQMVFKMYMPLYRLNQTFSNIQYSEIEQKIVDICKEEIHDGIEHYEKKRTAMFILSTVLKAEDFLKFVEKFYPRDSIAPVENVENQITYKLQQAILPCFRYFKRSHAALEPILKFCKGDYMQFAQKSLYYVCHNVAEKRLPDFLNVLNTNAVSVRKHSIFLALKLLDKTTTYAMLQKFMDNETNESIRKSLFKSVFNLFLRNPDSYTWSLVKENLKKIDLQDKEAFGILAVKTKKVPDRYFAHHVTFTWETLSKVPFNERIEECKCLILEAVTEKKIVLLPENFCMELIDTYLFKTSRSDLQEKIYAFTSKYIIYHKPQSLSDIFSIIKKFSKSSPKCVYKFVQEFCTHFVKGRNANKDTLVAFSKLWDNLLKPHEALEEYLHINFSLVFYNSENKHGVAENGKEIAKVFIALIEQNCGNVNTFSDILSNAFKDRFLTELEGNLEENNMIFIHNIVEYHESCYIVGLSLLPDKIPSTPKAKIIYDSIIETAGKKTDPDIQIQLHHHLINLE